MGPIYHPGLAAVFGHIATIRARMSSPSVFCLLHNLLRFGDTKENVRVTVCLRLVICQLVLGLSASLCVHINM